MATGTPTLLSDDFTTGGAIGFQGGVAVRMVPVSFTVGAYATGGAVLTEPAGFEGYELAAVLLLTDHDGTRKYSWDGSTTAPKIKAFTAFATEAANAADLSAITLKALLIYAR